MAVIIIEQSIASWRRRAVTSLFLVIAVVMLSSNRTHATISIDQSVDRTEMAFEDTARFQITVTWDGPAHAYIFEKPIRLESDLLKVARFSSKVKSTGTSPEEVTTKTFEYRLTPILSGQATVEAATVEYLTWPDSTSGQLSSDAFTISIDEPLPLEESDGGGLASAWIALIVVALIGGGVGAYAMFKPKPKVEKKRSPAEEFLAGLEDLRSDAGSDLRKFQTGLFRLLTAYINKKYRIDIRGQAAENIAVQLERAEPSEKTRARLVGWLRRAEKEKFAPLQAAPGDVVRLESDLKSFFGKES